MFAQSVAEFSFGNVYLDTLISSSGFPFGLFGMGGTGAEVDEEMVRDASPSSESVENPFHADESRERLRRRLDNHKLEPIDDEDYSVAYVDKSVVCHPVGENPNYSFTNFDNIVS